MKKSLILALTAAMLPAMAGDPVTIPAPPPPAPSPLSFEVGVGYNWACKDLIKYDDAIEKEIDTVGIDFTGIYALNENLSVNLRLGYAFGDEVEKTDSWNGLKHETDMHVFTIMPGVRYTHPLNDKLAVYGGANIGLGVVSVKDHYRDVDTGIALSGHGSDAGLAYSVELGVQYKLTETISAFAAWQVGGNTANPDVKYNWNDEVKTSKQVTTGIRCGVNVKF